MFIPRIAYLYERAVDGVTNKFDRTEEFVASTIRTAGFTKRHIGESMDAAVEIPFAAAVITASAVFNPKRTVRDVTETLDSMGSTLKERIATGFEGTVDKAALCRSFVAVHTEALTEAAKPIRYKVHRNATRVLQTAASIGALAIIVPLAVVIDASMNMVDN